ncbi:CLUMA_CG006568, isoform A, partial [Clunio marinus]
MEFCVKDQTYGFCIVNFLIAFISTISIVANIVCASVLIKLIPVSTVKTLLRLHKLRGVLLFAICLTSVTEIGCGFLLRAKIDGKGVSLTIESALFFFLSITSMAILLRLIEIRKSVSALRWIYAVLSA